MWDTFLQFLTKNKDVLDLLIGSGVVLAILTGIYRFIVWLIKEYRLRKTRSNANFPFKIISPNSDVAKEILGGADDDPLADRNIPYQQRVKGLNTRRELEESLEDYRCILISGKTGLGKTREAVQLAQSLNNKGWTILYLTREAWLDAPAKLPNNVPERKVLFFLDDLNKKCFSSNDETRPNIEESLTLPINEPFQKRLARTLDAFDVFCGKTEIRVIATVRNEKNSEYDEPSEWDKLGWTKYSQLWGKFYLVNLPEPDKTAEQKLLQETAKKANIFIDSNEAPNLIKRNDGAFRNLVENLSSAKAEKLALSSDNFRDTLKGTWQKRYQRVIQKHPNSKYIYDAIELLQNIDVGIRSSTVLQVVEIITNEHLFQRIKSRWKYSFILKQLSKTEDILHPRDGQIEAKGYRINTEKYLPILFKQVYLDLKLHQSIWEKIDAVLSLWATPKSMFNPLKNLGYLEKIWYSINNMEYVLYDVAQKYVSVGFDSYAEHLFHKAIEIRGNNFLNKILFKSNVSAGWLGLGTLYFKRKNYTGAIDACKKAIELNPKDVAAWHILGIFYPVLERYNDAIIAYKKAIDLDPKNARIWSGLGKTYLMLERYDDAINAHKKAIDLDPKNAEAWSGLGVIYSITKKFEKALSAYQKAIEISPEDGMSRVSLVGVLRKLGRETEATDQEKIARSLIDKESEYNRACFESICGNIEEALRLLKIALEQGGGTVKWVQKDPDFDFIRDDPRFKELVG